MRLKIRLNRFPKVVAMLAYLLLQVFHTQAQNMAPSESKLMTGVNFLERLKHAVTCNWQDETVDRFIEGHPNQTITGIATTFIASLEVLQDAVEQDINLIVTHEPTFYNHLDGRELVVNHQLYLQKLKFIRDHKLMIFRFHDHWHRTTPDGIYVGMKAELKWEQFATPGEKMIYQIPETTLEELARTLQGHFDATSLRVVGPHNLPIKHVALSVGAHGSTTELALLNRSDVDVLIVGETREWEAVEYTRDANAAGIKKGLIMMGHVNSEDAGMAHCADWLRQFISEVPIVHIAAGDPIWSPQRK